MSKNNIGSSLLMVICFTGAVSLMALSVWRTTMYNLESALARTVYTQTLKSTEGLLNLAIEVGIENFEKFMKQSVSIQIELPVWYSLQGKTFGGAIAFTPQKEHLEISAALKRGDHVYCSLRCNITKDPSGGYNIWAWTIDSQV